MGSHRSLDAFKQLRASAKSILVDFTTTSSNFRLVRSIPDQPPYSCKTIYILDSSFNPPSKAHLHLAANAAKSASGALPARLLLLLATINADKATKPAAFEDRIAMMILMAQALSKTISDVPVDVGITKMPIFMDKARVIDEHGVYGKDAVQIHLTGFDTITRIFNPKYYPDQEKLSVLDPFLSKHRLRVNYRLGDEYGTKEEQDGYVEKLFDGSKADQGIKKQWLDSIDLVDDAQDGIGISSTRVRKAVSNQTPDKISSMVLESVGDYIREMDLYHE